MTDHRDAIQQRLTEVLRGYLTQQEAILVEPVPMADVFLGITNFYRVTSSPGKAIVS
jgi:hypothetical protein